MIRIILAALLSITSGLAVAQDSMKMAVTTSFHNSGLSEVLLPEIQKDLDLEVQLLVVGTGQALRLGQAGDVDAVLVHSKKAEEDFVASGYATYRREIMYNDFVIIGPKDDPANLRSATSVAEAFSQIFDAKALTVSRGDSSGTHKKELSIWRGNGLEPDQFGTWYKELGAGMGAALNTAAGMNAYIMSDRASWLNFKNKADLNLVFANDPALFNQYAYLPVNPERHPHVKTKLVTKLEAWLTSKRAADLINSYKINGEVLFTFNATPQ